ncbi:ABC-2 type transport system ATP-binding protein [Catalinimonas alkaloidigena]|uniref:ABC transporter ATP-binding protein n=1 Tax=Catalinimonas alkaloidigena TaxID=1075417 RepID=UPI0024066995|nr:ABC transporter ATP-binding protein [Catalinimonas alkaloidigena]MDF9798278.1 ABC-2 type transport system ATP-binding protein [Catalinimonas alkaloidigena]
MILTEQISKQFGDVQALNEINLDVKEGELFGLIGPDGAGKTTLFRILTTLLLADRGKAKVGGRDVVKDYRTIRQHVGYMPGRFSLYPDLSVQENLEFFATVFGSSIQENYELIKDIYSQIEPFKDRKAGALSGGMKQKLALSCALIHRPKVLFMDEPTTGIDPVSRKELWEMLRKLKSEGITLLVSTPYMDEASLCERVALIQKGKIMTVDEPDKVRKTFSKTLWAVSTDQSMYRLLNDLRSFPETSSAYAFGEHVHLTLRQEHFLESLKMHLKELGHHGLIVNPIEASVEDRFMELMGKQETSSL